MWNNLKTKMKEIYAKYIATPLAWVLLVTALAGVAVALYYVYKLIIAAL